MIHKSIRHFKRRVRTYTLDSPFTDRHQETVIRTTYWLLWVVPLYTSDTVIASTI